MPGNTSNYRIMFYRQTVPFIYTQPLQVPGEIQELVNWIDENIDVLHPVLTAAVGHYNLVRIHPFDDGNGRGARILMNLVLMKKGFPPTIIKIEQRRAYLESLAEADKGDMDNFIELITKALIQTQKTILGDLK